MSCLCPAFTEKFALWTLTNFTGTQISKESSVAPPQILHIVCNSYNYLTDML